jgi:hypothetical protein
MTSIHVLDFNLFSPLGADANLGLIMNNELPKKQFSSPQKQI